MLNTLLLILANAIWAGSYSIIKWGVADIDPITLVFYRMFTAAIFLWLILGIFYRDQIANINRSFVSRILIVTAFDIFYHVGTCVGEKYSQAIDAALIISMEPVFLFVAATLVLKEKIYFKHILSLIVAMIGFVVLSDISNLGVFSFSNKVLMGDLIILVAVLAEAGFSITFKPLSASYSPLLLMAMVTTVQSVILAPIVYYLDSSAFYPVITPKLLMVVLYLALLCSVLGYVVWLYVMKKVSVNTMSISLFLQPAIGPVIASLSLGEKMEPRIFVGGAIIILALYLVMSAHFKRKYVPFG